MARRREWTRETLAAGVRGGDKRALARAISLVENGEPLAYELVQDLYPETGRAHSVDPSSPFSKGALLGDRIRLADHFLDPGVFIRSMGTRGHLGGLAEATLQAILVLMPGSGDSIQALKAGIMEIPDVIAINKMDHPAAKTMLNEVRSILSLDRERAWKPPIVLTEATRGENVDVLWSKIEEHRVHLEREGELEERRRRNLAGEVFAVASTRAKAHLEEAVADDPELRRLLDEVQRRELDPLSAVREIMDKVFHLGDTDGTDTR